MARSVIDLMIADDFLDLPEPELPIGFVYGTCVGCPTASFMLLRFDPSRATPQHGTPYTLVAATTTLEAALAAARLLTRDFL